jgi:1,2-beta-oligoglucan phosphorylase
MGLKQELTIRNEFGLSVDLLENGSIGTIDVHPIRINLKAGNLYSKPGTNIYLRKRGKSIELKALLGPESKSLFTVHQNAFIAKGDWDNIHYNCTLQLSPKSLSWQWCIDIQNNSDTLQEFDLLAVQDIGLKPSAEALINEYYVSQYLERSIFSDEKYGKVLCCRQNNRETVGNPWFMMLCKNTAISAGTDGMQFFGRTYRETGIPEGLLKEELGGEYAGESSVVALQEKPFFLKPGEKHRSEFVCSYLPDHPEASSVNDLKRIPDLLNEFAIEIQVPSKDIFKVPVRNFFTNAPFLPVEDLNETMLHQFFGEAWRHTETENGKILSFFYHENTHVMLRPKEIMADRPQGHIMQARAGYVPDESTVSTTSWAFGAFHSHLTQGNTNFNVFLSVVTSQFNQSPYSGQRIFVEIDGKYYLLGIPSAFETGLNHCRWIYKHGRYCFQVLSWTSKKSPQVNLDFKVLSGNKVKLLITHHFDRANGWKSATEEPGGNYLFRPAAGSMIAEKFPDARFRIFVQSKKSDYSPYDGKILFEGNKSGGEGFFVLRVEKTSEFCLSIIGEVCKMQEPVKIENALLQWETDCKDAQNAWKDLSLNLSLQGEQPDIAAIREILPWYGMNALTHYLTPHGLEQFGGAAWGTRDVSQGPVDLLLCLEKYEAAREVLLTIFSNQHPDGGWPQWWMFDSYFTIRAGDSHGDVYYWCLIALANYIKITGDIKILEEILPYYHEKGPGYAEKATLSSHADRLIQMIKESFIPGTSLVPFGGGDWNDSLQPVSKELAGRMVSSWTVEMNFQAFSEFQKVYELIGNIDKAKELEEICKKIKADFNRHLIKDGVIAGYGLLEMNSSFSVLLHPSDQKTQIHYSLLPMNRGVISGILTREQALFHQAIIEKHLKGPDGARLMDRPLKYKGGIQQIFQRAESSTFFGREIGLMYVHEHIRYAESQAILGNAEEFVKALRQANPVAYREIVRCGDIRQSNCYYSSSDVAFKSRYEADEKYDEIKTGKITLRGGWRVYSSGPGININLVFSRLLGLRTEFGNTILDPVIPFSMDGLMAELQYLGHSISLTYHVKQNNFGPERILINGKEIKFGHEGNKYRKGGAIIPTPEFLSLMKSKGNMVEIVL